MIETVSLCSFIIQVLFFSPTATTDKRILRITRTKTIQIRVFLRSSKNSIGWLFSLILFYSIFRVCKMFDYSKPPLPMNLFRRRSFDDSPIKTLPNMLINISTSANSLTFSSSCLSSRFSI